jgi:hypothetical protein
MVSEYRALRASVLRLWEEEEDDKEREMTRFNEAIDETLAESAVWYSDKGATLLTKSETFAAACQSLSVAGYVEPQNLVGIWSRRSGLNGRPADYESAALPLSYAGFRARSLF